MHRILLVAALGVAGCDGPGHVQYDGGRCLNDGRPMTSAEVEGEQAAVAQRIASRQPWFAFITIGVVLVAAASNAERALLLVRSHRVEGHRPLAERLRDVLARQRDSPVLFAAIVGGSLALAAAGGAFYIYLDIDKRASERALGMLQFCHHRAPRREGADRARRGAQKPPVHPVHGRGHPHPGRQSAPDEQRKAQFIVSQMNDALTQQGRIVGEYAARTDEAQKDLSTHTIAMEKGLASVEGDLAELRSLPTSLRDLEAATHRIDQDTSSTAGRFDDLHRQIGAVDQKVDSLLARPACSAAVAVAAPKVATSAPPDRTAPSLSPRDGRRDSASQPMMLARVGVGPALTAPK